MHNHHTHNTIIQELINFIAMFPGLGQRSAKRIVIKMLQNRETMMIHFSRLLNEVAAKVVECDKCGNQDIAMPCYICQDLTRDAGLLCVVEDIASLWNIEHGGSFNGFYHVLKKVSDSHQESSPYDIDIDKLISRINNSPEIKEVIIANNPNVTGQTIAFYISESLNLAELNNKVAITTLGQGLPIGSEIDYLDSSTVTAAFKSRKSLAN